MSFNTGQTRLHDALKDLLGRWDGVRQKWSDDVAVKFEEKHLDPLAANVRSATEAMGDMAALLTLARRDCE